MHKKHIFLYVALACALGMLVGGPAQADLLDGLVAAWTFDDGTAKDQTGNGHDGVLVGKPMPVPGKFGMGFDFNGKDTGIDIEDHEELQLTEPFTVAAWLFPRAMFDHAGIVWKGSMIGWGTDVYNFRIAEHSTNGFTWGACTGPVEGYFATDGMVDKMEKWYHVVLVEDGTKGIAYVNGETGFAVSGGDANRPNAPYAPLEGHPVRIGYSMGIGGNIGSEGYVDGIIDEVFLFNRPLSEEEVIKLMEQSVPLAVGPKGKLATSWGQLKRQ